MQKRIVTQVKRFLDSIGQKEKETNKELKKQIAFLQKYLGLWESGAPVPVPISRSLFQYYLTKEKYNA